MLPQEAVISAVRVRIIARDFTARIDALRNRAVAKERRPHSGSIKRGDAAALGTNETTTEAVRVKEVTGDCAGRINAREDGAENSAWSV